MHTNHLIFPLLSLLIVTYAAPEERRKLVRVITEPKPGEEYVSIQTGKPSSSIQAKSSGMKLLLIFKDIGTKINVHKMNIIDKVLLIESDIHVNIQDEGQTGIKEVSGPIPTEEKIYAVRDICLEINCKHLHLLPIVK